VFENNGQVGIGTTVPLDFLAVRYTNTNGGATGIAVQNLGNTNTSYSGMLFYDQTARSASSRASTTSLTNIASTTSPGTAPPSSMGRSTS
jgi:hypothetical protein